MPDGPRHYGDHGGSRQNKGGGKGKGGSNGKANFELNRKIIKMAEAVEKKQAGMPELLQEALQEHANAVNLSTAFHRIAKICRPGGIKAAEEVSRVPRFHELQVRVRDCLLDSLPNLSNSESAASRDGKNSKQRGDGIPMSVACVCWAHATLRLQDTFLFSEIARHCSPSLGAFKNLELSNLLWAFAKLGEQTRASKGLFKAAAGEALSRPDDFTVVNLSTLVWSFATARVPHGGLFSLVADRIAKGAQQAEGQEIANTLWAFATSGVHEESFFSRMGDEAVNKLQKFKAQESANVAWAFGRAKVPHLGFFGALEEQLRNRKAREGGIMDYEPQHLTMVISAIAVLHPISIEKEEEDALGDFNDDEEVKELVDEEEKEDGQDKQEGVPPAKLAKRKPGGSLATEAERNRGRCIALGFSVTLLPECLRQVRRFKPDEAARIIKACAKLGLDMEELPQVEGFSAEKLLEVKVFAKNFSDTAPK